MILSNQLKSITLIKQDDKEKYLKAKDNSLILRSIYHKTIPVKRITKIKQ